METWGSWTFDKENENLLDKVINEFATDQCSLDVSRKAILSSLVELSKNTRAESDSSSDDSSDVDIDGDFNDVQTSFSNSLMISNDASAAVVDNNDNNERLSKDINKTFDSELSFLSQRPVKNREDLTRMIIDLLNAGNHDPGELRSLLETELKNQKDPSKVIDDVWPEIITDGARHGLCEALIHASVRPSVVCEQIYLPWFKACELNLTGFIESLSKLIVYFPKYACESFIVQLLKNKESLLVKHLNWLEEIMKSLDQQYWRILLSEYTKYCDNMDQYQIPVLSHLVKNCSKCLNDNEAGSLVALCRNAVHEHYGNRDFALFLTAVIGAVDLNKFHPEMKTVCEQLKGASKFLVAKALKDAK